MERCVIFCAGGFDELLEPVSAQDLVIAADGGLLSCRAAGIEPRIILGDFDSLGYIPQGAVVHPTEKDDTDAMLAVRRGLEAGCREFLLYGSLDGPRLEHTVANFQTLQFLADRGARGFLIGLTQGATVLKKGTIFFPPQFRGNISVFAHGADARGVTIRGFHYGLEKGSLSCGFPLGVSNQFAGEPGRITVEEGSLLIIWDKNHRLPEVSPC